MRGRLIAVSEILAAASVALPLAGALGTRFGLWRFGAGFALLGAGVLAALAAIVFAVAGGWTTGRWGAVLAVIACGLIVIALPVSTILANRRAPLIHDVSTDTIDPPPFVALVPLRGNEVSPAAYDGPAAAVQQHRAYPDIQPIDIAAPPLQAFDRALAAARALGWHIAAQDRERGTLEATDTTFWFGFTDDIVIRVRSQGAGSLIDIRSKSRVGVGDLGANARRIRAFTAEMRKSRSG